MNTIADREKNARSSGLDRIGHLIDSCDILTQTCQRRRNGMRNNRGAILSLTRSVLIRTDEALLPPPRVMTARRDDRSSCLRVGRRSSGGRSIGSCRSEGANSGHLNG